ncbi:hypothetical protein [Methylorubrum sp. POS3]|uniref:hypothetical protein n=1 Tax=Methylorubrum sp. POS3 TaxID=2998492 RepID=UPI00372CCFAD
MNRPCRVALPWYLAGHYAALRARLADGAKLPERYETWLFSTEQAEREVQRSGVEVVRVTIEPDAFLAWCRCAGLPSDAAARSRYAAETINE